jgi:hypothetical protein
MKTRNQHKLSGFIWYNELTINYQYKLCESISYNWVTINDQHKLYGVISIINSLN